ncbi:hypothetical protein BPTFM16_02358 [Altererythrobacter insulae]|nr:hypothetical protein BPTFM16_02358 [Altererythrobacter insulae]
MGNAFAFQAQRAPISRHPAFVPLIAVWLALLLSGLVMVLPTPTIDATLAGAAATMGGAFGWIAAKVFAAIQDGMFQRQADAAVQQEELDIESADEAEDALEDTFDEPEFEAYGEVELLEADNLGVRSTDHDEVEFTEFSIEQEELDAAEMPTEEVEASITAEPLRISELGESDGSEPFYADIDLAGLLGGPRVAPEAIEDPVIEPDVSQTEAVTGPVQSEREEVAAELSESAAADDTTLADPAIAPPEITPDFALPQHGKAVNLLRRHATQDLAMPQLIERFAVALDDQRQIAEQSAHSYSLPPAPVELTQALRALTSST